MRNGFHLFRKIVAGAFYTEKAKMNSSDFITIAKQNNENIYLIEYKNKNGVGFVIDFNREVRYADGLIQTIRKKENWVDIRYR